MFFDASTNSLTMTTDDLATKVDEFINSGLCAGSPQLSQPGNQYPLSNNDNNPSLVLSNANMANVKPEQQMFQHINASMFTDYMTNNNVFKKMYGFDLPPYPAAAPTPDLSDHGSTCGMSRTVSPESASAFSPTTNFAHLENAFPPLGVKQLVKNECTPQWDALPSPFLDNASVYSDPASPLSMPALPFNGDIKTLELVDNHTINATPAAAYQSDFEPVTDDNDTVEVTEPESRRLYWEKDDVVLPEHPVDKFIHPVTGKTTLFESLPATDQIDLDFDEQPTYNAIGADEVPLSDYSDLETISSSSDLDSLFDDDDVLSVDDVPLDRFATLSDNDEQDDEYAPTGDDEEETVAQEAESPVKEEPMEEEEEEEEVPQQRKRKAATEDDDDDYAVESSKKKKKQKKVVAQKKKKATTKKNIATKKSTGKTDVKPFVCPICGHASKRRYNLTTHMKTHDKERVKEFPCDMCTKAFDRRHDRDRHVATVHEGRRAHTCATCGSQFSRGDALARHMEKHIE